MINNKIIGFFMMMLLVGSVVGSTNVFAQETTVNSQTVSGTVVGQSGTTQVMPDNGVVGIALPEPDRLKDLLISVGDTGRADGPGADLIVTLEDLSPISPVKTGSIKIVVADGRIACEAEKINCGTLYDAKVELFTQSGREVGHKNTESGSAVFEDLSPGIYIARATSERFLSAKKEITVRAGTAGNTVIYLEKDDIVSHTGVGQVGVEGVESVSEVSSAVSAEISHPVDEPVEGVPSLPRYVAKVWLSMSQEENEDSANIASSQLVSLKEGESTKYGNYILKFDYVLTMHSTDSTNNVKASEAEFSVWYQNYPSPAPIPMPKPNPVPNPSNLLYLVQGQSGKYSENGYILQLTYNKMIVAQEMISSDDGNSNKAQTMYLAEVSFTVQDKNTITEKKRNVPVRMGKSFDATPFHVTFQGFRHMTGNTEDTLDQAVFSVNRFLKEESYPVEEIMVSEDQGETIEKGEANIRTTKTLMETNKNPEEAQTKEILIKSTSECSDGCKLDDRCVNYGIRMKNGHAVYCDISGKFMEQKGEGNLCQNNYECETNQCSSGKCADMMGQLDEQNNMLQKIMSWFGRFF